MTRRKLTLKYFSLTFPPCSYLSFLKWKVKGKGQQSDCYMRAWRTNAFHRRNTAVRQSGECEPWSLQTPCSPSILSSPPQWSRKIYAVLILPLLPFRWEKDMGLAPSTCHLLCRAVRVVSEMMWPSDSTLFPPQNDRRTCESVFWASMKACRVLKL